MISVPGVFAWSQEQPSAQLPSGVRAVWDLNKAHRENTSTREIICINGLWQWQPTLTDEKTPPTGNWGWFKTPGSWPGITDYMQKDSHRVYAHPGWQNIRLGSIAKAWYQREIEIPKGWTERRILLKAEYVNSLAVVYIDGKRIGEILFPGGELDISKACKPGTKHTLSMELTALPLADVIAIFGDTNAPRSGEATVNRRGLCGDVFLVATPTGTRITGVNVETSVRKGEITVHAALENPDPDVRYALRVNILDNNKLLHTIESKNNPVNGRITVTERWKPEKLWDIHTPENMYQAEISLQRIDGERYHLVDEAIPVRFGFREFWIDGRDLYLNGSRIWLSCVPFDNAQIGAALANYEAAKETMLRLKTFGVNFVYTHNYDCNPGSYISFAEILRAADDVGMLVSFSQPHFGHYDWQSPDAGTENGYARLARFLVHEAQNHPSVIFYSMSHNATGYAEDMNPYLMDGIAASRSRWAVNNLAKAQRAENIVNQLDPGRIVYHHASGNLGPMHISNFYVNWVPVQEMSDWFGHWATVGVKPMFTCEYGVPFTWDWAMYRGWYKGVREFGSAPAPWEFCNAEWNAQFVGDAAFRIGEPEKKNLRWEAKQFHDGKTWRRWDYPHPLGSRDFTDQDTVFAKYITDNWRSFRTWGLSINSFWEHGRLWSLRPDMNRSRMEYKTDWDNLQRPGFSPDFQEQRYERIDIAFEHKDWILSSGAKALIRNNMPLLAYIGGKEGSFTGKDHNYLPGETVEKQFIVINNSRKTTHCRYAYRFHTDKATTDSNVILQTGQIEKIPFRFTIPENLPPGNYAIHAHFAFDSGDTKEIQEDMFTIHVMPKAAPIPAMQIALFDPKGETAKTLNDLGVAYRAIQNISEVKGNNVTVIIGKDALNLSGNGFDLTKVPDGLKVIVFEQTAQTLEKRLGFRTAEYGLRQVFRRITDHPLLTGIADDNLRDWRGEATLLPPRLEYETNEQVFNGVPTVEWCGITVPRVWRCGNRGNVASVLIEKPACGDFLPIVDGGFSLQYSPLMEYRQGKGLILFCQTDVTGRTEKDPAARQLIENMLRYVNGWKPEPRLKVAFLGDETAENILAKTGVEPAKSNAALLILGTGGVTQHHKDVIAKFRKSHKVLAIGLNSDELKIAFPELAVNNAEHISTFFEPFDRTFPLRGISPADLHNRDPKNYPLIATGVGNGIVAVADNGRSVICSLAPWQFPEEQQSFRRTYRRTAFTLSRILGNMNADIRTPLVNRFHGTVGKDEQRWLTGLYIDQPEEWDDPYRFFRW